MAEKSRKRGNTHRESAKQRQRALEKQARKATRKGKKVPETVWRGLKK